MKKVIFIIFVIFILILFISYVKCSKENFMTKKEMINKCDYFYDDDKRVRDIIIIPNIISSQECDKIIEEAKRYASKNSWEKNRHSEYPTTDNELDNSWLCYNMIISKIYKNMIPKFSKKFDIDESVIGINEIFVAKYSVNGQKKLEEHEDGSELSFVIALNDEYTGGGTYFTKLNRKVRLPKGSCVLFSGRESHKGLEITNGTRYILTGFLNIFNERFCEDHDF